MNVVFSGKRQLPVLFPFAVVMAAVVGCGFGPRQPTIAESSAALEAVVGRLPEGLAVLHHEHQGAPGSGTWVVRGPGNWRPREAAKKRDTTLPADTFMNLVAASTRGALDLGRPTASTCHYTEWQTPAANGNGRLDIRIHQLATDQGEFMFIVAVSDPN